MQPCSSLDTLADILMDVPDLVFAFARDGSYLFVNAAGGTFLDHDPSDLIGYHWRDFGFPEEVMGAVMEQVEAVFVTGVPSRFEIVPSPERGARLLDASLTPLRCDGEISGALLIARDVSRFLGD